MYEVSSFDPSPSGKTGLVPTLDDVKDYVRDMRTCDQSAIDAFHRILTKAVPAIHSDRAANAASTEVVSYLIPLQMSAIMGSSREVERAKLAMCNAIDDLKRVSRPTMLQN